MLKLFSFFKPYWKRFVVVVLLTLGQSVGTLSLPYLMSDIVDIGILKKGVTTAGVVGTNATQFTYILKMGGWMLLLSAFTMACAVGAGYLASLNAASIARDLRSKVFKRVESFSQADMNKFGVPSLIIRSTNDIAQVQQMSFMVQRVALIAPLMAIGAVFMTIRTNAQLAWTIVAVIPILAVIVVLTARYALPLFRTVQKKQDKLNEVAREGLTGVRVIRAFTRQSSQRMRFQEANDDLTTLTLKVNNVLVTLMPIMTIVIQFLSVAIIWFGAKMIGGGSLQLGSLMAFLQYTTQLMMAVMMLSMIFIMLPRAGVSAERVDAVITTTPSIVSSSTPLPYTDKAPLIFDDVSFKFAGADEPTLCNISFTAEPGTTTAIIGSTGSGKSTILALTERLYDPSKGTITFDGVALKDADLYELRKRIGYTPQKAVLFSGTIADNLRMGKADASEDEMWEALRIAQAEDFVRALPDGLAARVAEGGGNFSGGQKQRLAIARALIRKPSLYLFDDSFSALDLKTDARLRAAMAPHVRDAIVVTVAQRISTINHADQILVVDEGRIVEKGTHKTLMQKSEVYRDIARSQLTAEEWEAATCQA